MFNRNRALAALRSALFKPKSPEPPAKIKENGHVVPPAMIAPIVRETGTVNYSVVQCTQCHFRCRAVMSDARMIAILNTVPQVFCACPDDYSPQFREIGRSNNGETANA